jgi:hypothetical protein
MMLRSMEARRRQRSRAPAKNFIVVSLSLKRASLLDKFLNSEPGRDIKEKAEKWTV